MATLLTQRGAAGRCGKSVKWFRAVCRAGRGPRVFNPLDGRPMYVDTVVDEWMESRDDQPKQAELVRDQAAQIMDGES